MSFNLTVCQPGFESDEGQNKIKGEEPEEQPSKRTFWEHEDVPVTGEAADDTANALRTLALDPVEQEEAVPDTRTEPDTIQRSMQHDVEHKEEQPSKRTSLEHEDVPVTGKAADGHGKCVTESCTGPSRARGGSSRHKN
ncbi:hypothetical protein OS493_027892 [Desmophyllum pertusum]|uniref:Uncharacterized protein n=1 Tax=Desmophyllum pertusum TaxID=174260 RepID=A0A9W9YNS7_9CNID|nr:hypothetical protein OS493_027892 [Desmophyllum pertusum]